MNSFILIICDIISIITIALCFILKIPQIVRLYKTGSSVGLNLKGLLVELASYSITMMYNFTNGHAILTYLEYPILLIQEYIMIGLVLHHNQYSIKKFLALIAFFGSLYLIFAYGILHKYILKLLVPCTVPAGVLSKGMQVYEIVRLQNADSVSPLTWCLSVFTNAARIFTVYMDSGDLALLCNFSISTLLSSAVLLAALYYQRKPVKQE